VHVMQTPMSVGSHLHMHMVMLQQQAVMPFIIMQQLTMPPAIIEQRFWSIPAVTLSSQTQLIFIPPVHFSKVILHRGTIIMLEPVGAVPVAPIVPEVPVIPMPARSIIIVVMFACLSLWRILTSDRRGSASVLDILRGRDPYCKTFTSKIFANHYY
jgi:hypothetical protein